MDEDPLSPSSLPDLPGPSSSGGATSPLPNLEQLIRDHARAGGAVPGDAIGPYRLLSMLGEGGFGEVWLAERREPFVQRVAIKLIKPGMDSRAVLARFEQERQALAVMDHPNIARVLDGGVADSGRPYFVMEHVPGESITAFCDRHTYSVKQRLELFVQVCEAVQHAHHKGVIHRDIKPSNILVMLKDDRAIPKVIDFGVAKAVSHTLTERTIFTEQGRLIGTPEYMSPEQAEMGAVDIDTRTDVYSLGVVLYELLTGVLPFDPRTLRAGGYDAIRRIIREQDPPKPSTRLTALDDETGAAIARKRESERDHLSRQLRRELDWIPLKALRKDRTERYRTPADLADDIRRYSRGEPLTAGPESTRYRLRKLLRRHRAGVAMGSALAATLVTAAAVSTWFAIDARRQRDRAEERARDVQSVLDFEGEVVAGTDWRRVGSMLTRTVTDAVGEAIAKAGLPEDAASAELRSFESAWQRIDATDSALRLLDLASLQPTVAGLDAKFKDRPRIGAELRHTLATRYWLMGLFAPAAALEQQALESRRSALGDDHRDTLKSMSQLARYHRLLDKPELAEPLLREALARQRRALGPDDPDTLETVTNLAVLLRETNRLAEARPLYVEAFEGKRRVLGPDHRETLLAMSNLGVLLKAMGELEEAESCQRRALEGRRRTLDAADFDLINSVSNLASVLQARGKLDEAEPLYREALEGWRATIGSRHRSTLIAMNNLAYFLLARGRPDEAAALYKEAVETARESLGAEHSLTIRFVRNWANMLLEQGRAAEAAAMYESVEAGARKVYTGAELPNLASLLVQVGRARTATGEFAAAEGRLFEAAGILDGPTTDGSKERTACINACARLYEAWDRAEPGRGFDGKAAEWRSKLSAAPPAPGPAGAKP